MCDQHDRNQIKYTVTAWVFGTFFVLFLLAAAIYLTDVSSIASETAEVQAP